jgi:hypothetical protein
METTPEFYQNGYGDRFIDPSLFNDEVAAFLQGEEQILNTVSCRLCGIIEVGCMHGRYMEWAIRHRKRYFGVDVVERYISRGQQSLRKRGLPAADYHFILGSMEQMPKILNDPHVSAHPEEYLMLFPFNSFGNMDYPEAAVRAMENLKLHAIISTYQTTDYATNARAEYYARCGYQDLHIVRDACKVGVTSAEGLRSYAFNPTYLIRQFRECGVPVVLMPFANIGMACLTAGVGELLGHYEAAPTLYPREIVCTAPQTCVPFTQPARRAAAFAMVAR